MVYFRVAGSHDDARTFISTLSGGTATHLAGGTKGKVPGGTLLGKKHDNATISLTYTLSTKRMQVMGPSAVIDLALTAAKSLEQAFSAYSEAGARDGLDEITT